LESIADLSSIPPWSSAAGLHGAILEALRCKVQDIFFLDDQLRLAGSCSSLIRNRLGILHVHAEERQSLSYTQRREEEATVYTGVDSLIQDTDTVRGQE
jgi:hypothetical protein